MDQTLKLRLEDAVKERKETKFAPVQNIPGSVADFYKNRTIEYFDLNSKYSEMLMSLPFDTVKEITKDLLDRDNKWYG